MSDESRSVQRRKVLMLGEELGSPDEDAATLYIARLKRCQESTMDIYWKQLSEEAKKIVKERLGGV